MNQLTSQQAAGNQKKVNPLMAFMFLQMTFKAWNNYSIRLAENNEDKYAPSVISEEPEDVESIQEEDEDDVDYNAEYEEASESDYNDNGQ